RLLALATIPSYRATLLLQRARAARELGDVSAAQTDLLMAIETAPESAAAAQALNELDALGAGSTVPVERRAAIAFATGRYADAIAAYSAMLDGDPARADAWYQRAIARVRSGDLGTGVQELVAMGERYPQDARTPDALVTAGTLVEWDNEAGAEQLYRGVLAQYPGSSAAREAQFRLGLLAYGRGDMEGAAALWERLAAGGDVRATFWYGKALAARGDLAGAQQAWQQVLQSDPQSFYGQRARELVRGELPVAKAPGQVRPLEPDDRPLTTWLASLHATNETVAQRVQVSGAARRALLLLDLGEREAAGWEVDVAADELSEDPMALAAFGWELLRRGEAAYAYRIGLRLATRAEVPQAVRAPLLEPVPYPESLVPVSMRFGVDPLLLAALIRQESEFEPTAVSPTGARGLTQVMPETGAKLAQELGLTRWTPDDLFRPTTSIMLGAAELARRLEQFQGQLYLALASYNAGAGAVQRWLRERPTSDPDLFAERIPYRETRAYVQRVYAGYRAYQELYGAE
ncbi:MAG: transglycosylase SLT domain-containing protein, partial [Thermomicrobium sp.]